MTVRVKVHIEDDSLPPELRTIGWDVSSDSGRNLRELVQLAANGAVDQLIRIGHESWRKGRVLTADEIERLFT